MLSAKRYLGSLALLAGLFSHVIITGCAARVGVGNRVYDPYYRDHHRWDDNETVYYNLWRVETHREPHREYRKLNRDEQNEYWKWRHDHPDKR